MSLLCVELWLHPLPTVPAVVQSHNTDAASCWSAASASQGLAGAELAAAAAREEPLGAACARLLSRGWGLLLRTGAGAPLSAELAAPSGKFMLSF